MRSRTPGLDGAVKLSNSVSLADVPRLRTDTEAGGGGGGSGGAHGSSSVGIGPSWTRGQLLVAKVLLRNPEH